jgi:hypothetical protein
VSLAPSLTVVFWSMPFVLEPRGKKLETGVIERKAEMGII